MRSCIFNRRAHRRGLTLLELLVVVAILAALALGAVSLTENADDQLRFDQTRGRLDRIQAAIAGETENIYGGQRLLSGYVSDCGRLPVSVRELLAAEGQAMPMQCSPVYDPSSDSDYLDNDSGDETVLSEADHQLLKGWRGPYLQTPVGTDAYRDGWGNVGGADDGENFGWGWDAGPAEPAGAALSIRSLGADGIPGGVAYDADISAVVMHRDVGVDAAGVRVRVVNRSGEAVDGVRVALLVWWPDSGSPDGRWRQFRSGGAAIAEDDAHTFAVTEGAAAAHRVPVGRHLVVLVDEVAAAPFDAEPVRQGLQAIAQPIDIFAGTTPERLTLTIPTSN